MNRYLASALVAALVAAAGALPAPYAQLVSAVLAVIAYHVPPVAAAASLPSKPRGFASVELIAGIVLFVAAFACVSARPGGADAGPSRPALVE